MAKRCSRDDNIDWDYMAVLKLSQNAQLLFPLSVIHYKKSMAHCRVKVSLHLLVCG